MLKKDRVAGIVILLISTGLCYGGWSLPAGARVFPLALLTFIIIGSIVMIAKPSLEDQKEEGNTKKIYLTVFICAAYAALVEVIGYFIATALFMTVFMAMMGLRSIRLYLAVIIGVNICLYLLFIWQLKVPVPIGTLFQ